MEKIKIESSDIFEYIFPHDISCSPDGKHIAYIISNINEEKDCYEHDLYVMDIKTEKQIHMTQTKDVHHLVGFLIQNYFLHLKEISQKQVQQIFTLFL